MVILDVEKVKINDLKKDDDYKKDQKIIKEVMKKYLKEGGKGIINIDSIPRRDQLLETVIARLFGYIIKKQKYRNLFKEEIKKKLDEMK